MLERIKRLFWAVVFFAFYLAFRRKPGPVVRNFVKNLGFVFSGLVLSKVFSFTFQVLSGRLLGRVEYGKFALAYSISNILWTFMYLAIGTAMVKYLASAKDDRERMEILSTGIILTIIATVSFSAAFCLASVPLSAAFSISLPYMFSAIAMAVGLNIWIYAEKVCQGLDRMKKLGLLNVVWSLVMLVISMALYVYTRTAIVPIVATTASYLVSSLLMVPDMRRYFRFRISGKWLRILAKYSLINVVGTISFSTLGAVNKIFLNIYLSVGDVGLYQAYYYSTIVLAYFLLTGFTMVFFPESSRYKDKPGLFSKLNRLIKLTPLFYIFLLAASAFILFLYGSEYSFILPLLLLFVLASVVSLVQSLYNWFAASLGIAGVKATSLAVGVTCIIDIAAALLLIPPFGIYGAAGSIIISYMVGMALIYFATKRILKNRENYS